MRKLIFLIICCIFLNSCLLQEKIVVSYNIISCPVDFRYPENWKYEQLNFRIKESSLSLIEGSKIYTAEKSKSYQIFLEYSDQKEVYFPIAVDCINSKTVSFIHPVGRKGIFSNQILVSDQDAFKRSRDNYLLIIKKFIQDVGVKAEIHPRFFKFNADSKQMQKIESIINKANEVDLDTKAFDLQ